MNEMKENKKVKDSVFTDLFQNYRTAKENVLSIYNALHDTAYHDPDIVTTLHIEDALYMDFKNDVSFLIGDKLLVLIEHQSTLNENMPFRFLLYVAQLYKQIVPVADRYRRKLTRIPTPEFYVFYNGKQNYGEEETLWLSDAYRHENGEIPIELKVKIFNINEEKGRKLLEKCDILKQYTDFIETVRRYDTQDDGFRKAIQECIRKDILKDYLEERGVDIINFLSAQYDYETDVAVQRMEEREKCIRSLHKRGVPVPDIARDLETSEEEVKKVILSDQK